MRKIAVTGATGFIGSKLVERLTSEGKIVHAIARNEGKLAGLKDRYKNVRIFPCPVEDPYLLRKALKDVDGVFHLAAMKDVGLAEQNTMRMVESNITGTLNLLKASVEFNNIRFVVGASSDKAVNVAGVYGASKLIAERLFGEFEEIGNPSCTYRTVRYGNILYSTSSVLVKWKNALQNGESVRITDPEATRYFLTVEDAVNALFGSLDQPDGAGPYLPPMKALSMQDLLDLMIRKYGKPENVIRIGLQEGENKHEKIHTGHSSETAERWDAEELLQII